MTTEWAEDGNADMRDASLPRGSSAPRSGRAALGQSSPPPPYTTMTTGSGAQVLRVVHAPYIASPGAGRQWPVASSPPRLHRPLSAAGSPITQGELQHTRYGL